MNYKAKAYLERYHRRPCGPSMVWCTRQGKCVALFGCELDCERRGACADLRRKLAKEGMEPGDIRSMFYKDESTGEEPEEEGLADM